jgi:MOSC domain-containing protein
MVDWIWRYPLKSAQGESLKDVFVGRDGPAGDRSWACVSDDGIVVSAKHPRKWGRMLYVTATLVTTAHGEETVVRIPGREPLTAGTADTDLALSEWLGARVRLTREVPRQPRLHRLWPKEPGMIPDWAGNATPAAGEEEISEIAGAVPGGRFVDFGAVHLVTTSAVDALKREAPAADIRRLRPNLVLSLDREPVPGDHIKIGHEVALRVLFPTPRCAIPGAAQPGLESAPEVLRAIGRRRVEIPGIGRAACFGMYAQVLSPGNVAVGDPATIAA